MDRSSVKEESETTTTSQRIRREPIMGDWRENSKRARGAGLHSGSGGEGAMTKVGEQRNIRAT